MSPLLLEFDWLQYVLHTQKMEGGEYIIGTAALKADYYRLLSAL